LGILIELTRDLRVARRDCSFASTPADRLVSDDSPPFAV
jgi:hypothetical protein